MTILSYIISGVVGYLLGSLNSSLIVGKFHGVDIRKHGSGNAGATNALRTLGKSAAAMVSIGDILKGVVAALIGRYIAGDVGLMLGAFSAIIGHNWPVFFGFKGGKGILTSFAAILMMDYKIGLILLGIFIIVLAITKYVSLGSILGSALFPVIGFFMHKENKTEFLIFATMLAILAIYRHSANIKRLLNGTESKMGSKKVKA